MKRTLFAFCVILCTYTTALALPVLQLGPGASGTWTYDTGSQTWLVQEGTFELNAYANAAKEDGGNGRYAWDLAGVDDQTAYLIISAVPASGSDGVFDVTVRNDGAVLAAYSSGSGTPPIEDPNSIAGHGIYDTYFELYEFNFDGSLGTIYNTQPGPDPVGGIKPGEGYTEIFGITLNSLATGVKGIHFDLFTVVGNGSLDDQIVISSLTTNNSDKKLVSGFAPFSHDAQVVPEPATLLMLGTGLIGIGGIARRRPGKAGSVT